MSQVDKKAKEEAAQPPQIKVKKVPTHMGTCSFSKASREVSSAMSKKQDKLFFFEEKRTGDVWEIEFNIKKIPPELKTDEQGRVWKRIS